MPEANVKTLGQDLLNRYNGMISNLDKCENLDTRMFMDVFKQSGLGDGLENALSKTLGREITQDDIKMYINEAELMIEIGNPPEGKSDFLDNDGNARVTINGDRLNSLITTAQTAEFNNALEHAEGLMNGNNQHEIERVNKFTMREYRAAGVCVDKQTDIYIFFKDGYVGRIDGYTGNVMVSTNEIRTDNGKFEAMVNVREGALVQDEYKGGRVLSVKLRESLQENYSKVTNTHEVDLIRHNNSINYSPYNIVQPESRRVEIDGYKCGTEYYDRNTFTGNLTYNDGTPACSIYELICELEFSNNGKMPIIGSHIENPELCSGSLYEELHGIDGHSWREMVLPLITPENTAETRVSGGNGPGERGGDGDVFEQLKEAASNATPAIDINDEPDIDEENIELE